MNQLETKFKSMVKAMNLQELPYQKDFLTNPIYTKPGKPIVFAAGTSAGKTFTMIMWLEMFYSTTKGYKPTLVIPASKTVLRDNTETALLEFNPTFSYSIVTCKDDLVKAIKDKIQVIVALPQTLNASIDILPKFERFVLDEAHQWYFKNVIKKVLDITKPKVQLLLTGSPYRFNAQADKFSFKYVSVMELYDLGHVNNARIEVVSSSYDFKQNEYLSNYGNLRSGKTNSPKKAKEALEMVCDEMITKLRSGIKNKYTSNWSSANKVASLFNELDKTIIYTHSKKQADTFHKILNSKKGLEGRVLISHSENDGKSELFKQFQTDSNIKILVAVDRGRLGFNMPELYNIVDFTMTQSLEMLQQMYGRLLRKSSLNPNKVKTYYKVATKNTADYFVDLMTAMLCLATNDEPTYYYSSYNGKNMGGIRIPKVLMNGKRIVGANGNKPNKSKTSKPYVSLVELGIPNDMNIFKNSTLHSSAGLFESIAWTTLDEVRREFFELRNSWNNESAINEAKKYSSIRELRDNSEGAYKHIKLNNLEKDAFSNYVNQYKERKVVLWNKDSALNEAKNYDNREAMAKKASGALKFLKRNNLLDLCFPIIKKEVNLDTALDIAKKYGEKLGYKEFPKKYKTENWILSKNGYNYKGEKKIKPKILDENAIIEIASKFKTSTEFHKKGKGAANKAKQLGIFDKLKKFWLGANEVKVIKLSKSDILKAQNNTNSAKAAADYLGVSNSVYVREAKKYGIYKTMSISDNNRLRHIKK